MTGKNGEGELYLTDDVEKREIDSGKLKEIVSQCSSGTQPVFDLPEKG